MLDWCLYGNDKREEMDRDLEPEYLWDTLQRYQDVFGEEFGVKEPYAKGYQSKGYDCWSTCRYAGISYRSDWKSK